MVKQQEQSAGFEQKDKNRILIVDDDPDIRDSLRDVLQLDGKFTVRSCGDVFNAKKLAAEFHPHIALIDIKLGNDNGLDLVPVLKHEFPGTICIVMTAYRATDYAVTAVKADADDYLFKPLDMGSLFLTLEKHLFRQRLEREKREAENRFRAIFEGTHQHLYILDADGIVVDVNDVALESHGLEKQQVVGTRITALPYLYIGQQEDDNITRALDSATEGRMSDLDINTLRSNGEALHLRFSFVPISSETSKVDLILVEGRDINEKILAEQMKKDKEKAEAANQAKSDFLSRMSHELRTPLNAILGFGQLLEMDQQEPLSEIQRDSVGEIINAGNHLLELVNDMLDLSRIEAGKVALNMTSVSVCQLIDECLALVRPEASSRGIEFASTNAVEDGCFINADPVRLKQILVNLLTNAVKYNRDNGAVTVNSECTRNGCIRVNVIDTGRGIGEDLLPLLFQPFERLGAENSDIEGTGIGLTVTQRLVKLMGGTIGVQSQPGQGSTFWVEFEAVEDGTE